MTKNTSNRQTAAMLKPHKEQKEYTIY